MSVDVIKEYLVSIGFDINDKSFNKVNAEIKQFEKMLGQFSQSIAGKFLIAGTAVEAFALTATVAIGKFAQATAAADREVELFARRMLTTESNARSLKSVMDAMGLSSIEQLKDVNLNPEMRKQFQELRALTQGLEPGADVQEQLANIRSLGFEFQKFQVLVSYNAQYIAGYLAKYLNEPLMKLKNLLSGGNKKFKENFTKIADQVAKFLSFVVKFAEAGLRLVAIIGKMFVKVGEFLSVLNKLPGVIKAIAVSVGALGLAIRLGPWGMITAAVSSLILLMDDYAGWKEGKQSALPGVWKATDGLIGTISTFIANIDANVQAIASFFGVGGQKIYGALKGAAGGAALGAGIGSVVPFVGTGVGAAVGAGVGGVAGWMNEGKPLTGKAKAARKTYEDMGKSLKNGVNDTLEYLMWVAKEEGLRITSTTGGKHNKGSKHYKRQAIDFDHRGITKDKIARLKEVYGLTVLDETTRPKGQAVWGGAHYHAQITPEQLKEHSKKNGMNIVINVNGAKEPKAVATEVERKIRESVMGRNMRGAFA